MVLLVASCGGQDIEGLPSIPIEVAGERLSVAVADDTFERASGLKGVDDLGALDGMLFVFERPTSTSFLMLDTLIPLDIWWFDPEGVLVATAEMEPCPAEPCPRYRPPQPALWALETPMGLFEFERGSRLVLPRGVGATALPPARRGPLRPI